MTLPEPTESHPHLCCCGAAFATTWERVKHWETCARFNSLDVAEPSDADERGPWIPIGQLGAVRLRTLRALLAPGGLHVVDDADKRVLDAMAARERSGRALAPSDLLRREGYELVVDPLFYARPDVIGDPDCCPTGILLTGKRYAAAADHWIILYSAAHEIAHDLDLDAGRGWCHDDEFWSLQASILARWVRVAAGVHE